MANKNTSKWSFLIDQNKFLVFGTDFTCPEHVPHAFDYYGTDDACCENPVADGTVRKEILIFLKQNS